MKTPYQTLRERCDELERQVKELEGETGEGLVRKERDWYYLKHSITCLVIDNPPPGYPMEAEEAWREVVQRLAEEHVLFQFAAPWLVYKGYRVTKVDPLPEPDRNSLTPPDLSE